MSIQDIADKFKGFLADDSFFYGMLLVLLAVTSFGLGRQSVEYTESREQSAGIVLREASEISVNGGAETEPGLYVGSKNTDKYHHVTCPGAAKINEENKVWFVSAEAAEAAGYSKAGNCEV